MNIHFIWGQGGVGKSHVALKTVASAPKPALLITLDPSLRILELVQTQASQLPAQCTIGDQTFTLKSTSAKTLFLRLEEKIPAHPSVRAFYERMAEGLQEFRDYLHLLQLSDELKSAEYATIVIDTPPFQEALGLHLSARKLRSFFSQSLVQFALKTAQVSWLQTTVKRVFEVTRIFVGRQAATQVFDFIEYLSKHTERFTVAADRLESLFFSKETKHHFVLTPETPPHHLTEIQEGFSFCKEPIFRINRSALTYSSAELPELKIPNAFTREILEAQKREHELLKKINERFPQSQRTHIPLRAMGEDSLEELKSFVDLHEA